MPAKAKKFYHSKTILVNLFAAVALFVSREYGVDLGGHEESFLVLANILLRFVTAKPVSF